MSLTAEEIQLIKDTANIIEKDALVMKQLATETPMIVLTQDRVEILQGLARISLELMDKLNKLVEPPLY